MKPSNHVELTHEAVDWINGELLGDGCLCSQYGCSAAFHYSSKYLEYIQYVSNTLNSFGVEQVGSIRKVVRKNGHSCYNYASRSYVELLLIRNRWYPNGKKKVPRDIVLVPTTLRQWYIGDGCLQHNFARAPWIILATDSFSIYDVDWLVEQLSEIGISSTRRPSNNRICISSVSVKAFLDYVGECPVDCYKYKWDWGGQMHEALRVRH